MKNKSKSNKRIENVIDELFKNLDSIKKDTLLQLGNKHALF